MWDILTIRERITTIRIRTTSKPLNRLYQSIQIPWFKLFTPEAHWGVDLHLKIIQAPSDSICNPIHSTGILIRDLIRKPRFHQKMSGLDTE